MQIGAILWNVERSHMGNKNKVILFLLAATLWGVTELFVGMIRFHARSVVLSTAGLLLLFSIRSLGFRFPFYLVASLIAVAYKSIGGGFFPCEFGAVFSLGLGAEIGFGLMGKRKIEGLALSSIAGVTLSVIAISFLKPSHWNLSSSLYYLLFRGGPILILTFLMGLFFERGIRLPERAPVLALYGSYLLIPLLWGVTVLRYLTR